MAILAAMLFPSFSRARESARRASCQSNLRQLGMGLAQYLQDYDDRYPDNVLSAPSHPYGWGEGLQPYVKSVQIFQCPSDPVEGTGDYTAQGPYGAPATAASFMDYGFNRKFNWLHEAQVAFPTLSILVSETGPWDGTGFLAGPLCNGVGPGVGIGGPHLDGFNVLLADGHVKWTQADKTWGGGTPWSMSGSGLTIHVQADS